MLKAWDFNFTFQQSLVEAEDASKHLLDDLKQIEVGDHLQKTFDKHKHILSKSYIYARGCFSGLNSLM